jgi:TonB-dependent starch-binding outer membrane protein SusC
MKIKATYISVLVLFFWSVFTTLAQDKSPTLKGTIKDDFGSPIIGATIRIKNSKTVTSTDTAGNYELVIRQPLPVTIIVEYIGLKPKEIEIYEEPTEPLEVQLRSNNLAEVVVVGYETKEKKDLTGAVSRLDGEDTKNIPTGSFDNQIQGKVAGVQIFGSTGVPGEATNVRVRGATSINSSVDPLYIVDGVFIQGSSLQTINTGGKATSPIADINPSDIESIEVLKDAEATAIYGSRGANGVIVVTTKRGNYEQKNKINFNVSEGWAFTPKLWDLATGTQHAQLVNENFTNEALLINPTVTGILVPYRAGANSTALGQTFSSYNTSNPTDAARNLARGTPDQQQTYDRLNEAFRTARVRNYDLNFSGGTKTSRYYVGVGYTKQEAILRPIDFQRLSFKFNLDQKLNDRITVGFSNQISSTYRNQGRAGDGPQGGILQAALHTPTLLSPYDASGNLTQRAGFDNLTLLLNNYNVNSNSLRYIGNLYGEAEIIPGLKFKTSWSADYDNYKESEYWNTNLLVGAPSTAGTPGGLATKTLTEYTTLLNEQTLTYRKVIGAHNFGALVGNTLQSNTINRSFTQGNGFPNNSFDQVESAGTTSATQSGTPDYRNWDSNSLASFFGKIDYTYNKKYIFNASLRTDGSSKFIGDKRWGTFYALGAAWRVKQELFLKNVDVISDLKLRGSLGTAGNQGGIRSFGFQELWGGGSNYNNGPGVYPAQLPNPNLGWEKTFQWNLGFDLGLFKNKVVFDFNYYNKYTSDGLVSAALSNITGFTNYLSNVAEISNKGLELGITTRNIENKNFQWTTNFNIARNVNKIEKLPTPVAFGSRNLILQQEGTPLYSFWVYKELGVDPQTGNVIYDDYNKDGKINSADRQIVGSIWPEFFGGLTNTFRLKTGVGEFDLNVFLVYQYGNKIYNHNRFFGEGGGARDQARVILASNVDRWQKPGDVTDTPRPDGLNNTRNPNGLGNYVDGGGRWLEDGSFIRLRDVTLGYTLPSSLTQSIKIERLRVYVQGSNLLLFTKYTGLDPESAANSSPNQQGIDLGTPPSPRVVQVGANITF